ncbi:IS1595 family transposase [Candidatus Acetothermia bacterium]|nr:IS1595 family transposase [Candidatus Acetothermia bacterium]
MDHGATTPLLQGTVEVDETYVGGKMKGGKPGRGSENKTPVVALIERNGKARSKPVERVDAKSLKEEIRKHVDPSAKIMTDEWPSYQGIGNEFEGGHHVVNHGLGEYSRDDVHTNTAESYFALLKRGHYGVFHSFSKEHLHRYCHEFSFRWNHRESADDIKRVEALRQVEGKRLYYKKP